MTEIIDVELTKLRAQYCAALLAPSGFRNMYDLWRIGRKFDRHLMNCS